jgi:hypothetical protein
MAMKLLIEVPDAPASTDPYMVVALVVRCADSRVIHRAILPLPTLPAASHALEQLRQAYGPEPAVRPALAGERLMMRASS